MSHIYNEGDRQIRTSVGQTVNVELKANPTTGCRWKPIADGDIVTVEEQEFKMGPADIGSGGKQWFTIRPVKSGTTRVRFEYAQPWEGAAEKTCDFDLEIDPH